MPEISVLQCDLPNCDNTSDVKRYTITVDGATTAVLACSEHAQPMIRLVNFGTKVDGRSRPPARVLTTKFLDSLYRRT